MATIIQIVFHINTMVIHGQRLRNSLARVIRLLPSSICLIICLTRISIRSTQTQTSFHLLDWAKDMVLAVHLGIYNLEMCFKNRNC